MKFLKAISFLILFIGINIQLYSQAAILALLFGEKVASETFNISMEIGGAFSYYSDVENFDRSKLGINFGIAGNVMVNKNFFISPNIYFLAQRKAELSKLSLATGQVGLDEQYRDVSGELSLNYIDVPILFYYQTNNKKYRFGIGPQFSFLQNAEAIYDGEYGDFTDNIKSNLNNFDYGPMVDLAYVLGKAHKGKGIHIHARYYYGMTDIFKNDVSNGTNQNSFWSVHISLPFITDELAEKNLRED